MKATINRLYKDSKITIWGESCDNHKTFLEVDTKSARYIMGNYSNVVALKSACGYTPEVGKWWVALA